MLRVRLRFPDAYADFHFHPDRNTHVDADLDSHNDAHADFNENGHSHQHRFVYTYSDSYVYAIDHKNADAVCNLQSHNHGECDANFFWCERSL